MDWKKIIVAVIIVIVLFLLYLFFKKAVQKIEEKQIYSQTQSTISDISKTIETKKDEQIIIKED